LLLSGNDPGRIGLNQGVKIGLINLDCLRQLSLLDIDGCDIVACRLDVGCASDQVRPSQCAFRRIEFVKGSVVRGAIRA